MTNDRISVLGGIKVLDIAEDKGLFAAKMLADLGADVIKIEKPEGSQARQIGPFKDDIPGRENSLYFLNFNTNKRSITLNLDQPTGQEIFKRLVKHADILIEDSQPGTLHSLGLDYPALRLINKNLIMASITGFGQTGPYANYKAQDMVSFAMGGMMNVNGPVDAAPVVAPDEQAFHSVSVASVFAILAALFLRITTGEGQLIDASSHEMMATLAGGIMQYSNNTTITPRAGSQFGAVPGRIYPCKDGYVHVLTIRPNHWQGFLEVMGNPEVMKGKEWLASNFRNSHVDLIDAHVIEFTMTHTKMEITEMCQAQGVPCTPLNTPADIQQDPHLQERGFFTEVEHPVVGRSLYPGPPYRFSRTPCRITRPAPLLGEHNLEVFKKELGYTNKDLENFKAQGII